MAAIATMPERDLAQVLSVSQTSAFLQCSARWYFQYALKLPNPKTSNLALGIAVHDALAANFHLKAETREDLPVSDVVLEYEAAWAGVVEETEFREDEDPPVIAAQGRSLIELYMQKAAPSIQPRAVEMEVTGLLGGVPINGKIDLIDQDWRIREIKTSARKSSTISAAHKFQLATYAALAPNECRSVAVDQLVKTKTPQLVQIDATVSDEDLRLVENVYPLAQQAMLSGIYVPNRASQMCSWKHCAFARTCEREFGGTVPGECE